MMPAGNRGRSSKKAADERAAVGGWRLPKARSVQSARAASAPKAAVAETAKPSSQERASRTTAAAAGVDGESGGVGSRWRQSTAGTVPASCTEGLSRCLQTIHPSAAVVVELRLLGENQVPLWCVASLTALPGGGFFCTLQDFDARKKQEVRGSGGFDVGVSE